MLLASTSLEVSEAHRLFLQSCPEQCAPDYESGDTQGVPPCDWRGDELKDDELCEICLKKRQGLQSFTDAKHRKTLAFQKLMRAYKSSN